MAEVPASIGSFQPYAEVMGDFSEKPSAVENPIKNGYGEYVVYRHKTEKVEVLSEEEFQPIYDILNKHRFFIIDKKNPDSRFDILSRKIKALDASLEIVFIPRTLYDLAFFQQCIQEDLRLGKFCNAIDMGYLSIIKLNQPPKEGIDENCFWQLCWFNEEFPSGYVEHENDYRANHLRKISSRLNNVILEHFKGEAFGQTGFSLSQIEKIHERILSFFKEIHESSQSPSSKQILGMSWKNPYSILPFVTENCRFPLGIYNERHQSIFRNAIKLECSAQAENAVILYRGSVYENDGLIKDGKVQSLSWGTSLLEGAAYDHDATPFHYMRKSHLDALALIVPFEDLKSKRAPFNITRKGPIVQACSSGEVFHSRTLVWELNEKELVSGFVPSREYRFIPRDVKTKESQQAIVSAYEKYKQQTIFLAKREKIII